MAVFQSRVRWASWILSALLAVGPGGFVFGGESRLPVLGRDTVLVWKIKNLGFEAEFVVRIAEFSPDRFFEWEDDKTQGTIFIPSRDVQAAKGFVGTSLFVSGVDSRGKNATTLWLSSNIFRNLKDKGKSKCELDGVPGVLTYRGEGRITVEVNRSLRELPVIKVSDDRGSERWFLDQEDDPLLVLHRIREFSQTLASITTDRPNTLRWIKGKKLANLPH
jgi:hypothetical protein